MMNYYELDENTRKWMLKEFDSEQSKDEHYQSKSLNQFGLESFPNIMRNAITGGNIESLTEELSNPSFWNSKIIRKTNNGVTSSIINPETKAKMLAHSEFNTIYTRGLTRRLMEEGETECEIYRADMAITPKCECTIFEGKNISLEKIYSGHRAKYFPKNNSSAFSIPSVPNCHHTIKRIN